MKAHFNLIDEQWIPCVPLDGGPLVERSITEVLTNASAYKEVYDNSPLVTVSVLRLLLAVLHRACGPTNLREARALMRDGLPVDRVRSYLGRWRERFDLFDEQHPFFQVAELMTGRKKGTEWVSEPVSVIRLANEAPDKNQPLLFDHRSYTSDEPMEPAEAARYLAAIQSYALASSQSSNAQIGGQAVDTPGCTQCAGIEGIWCWLEGRHLAETLALNLIPQANNPSDTAVWEVDDALQTIRRSWVERQLPRGIADHYTWQSRMVRLAPVELDGKTVVTSVFYTQGRSPKGYEDDPMYSCARPDDETPWDPIPLRRHRAVWRDSHALLKQGGKVRPPASVALAAQMLEDGVLTGQDFTLHVVGVARGREAAKQVLWRHDRLPTSGALLRDSDLVERLDILLQHAEQTAWLVFRSTGDLCRAYLSMGDKSADPDAVSKLADEIDPRRQYWAKLEDHFYALLRNLPQDKDASSVAWNDAVIRTAYAAFNRSADQLGQSSRAIRARAIVSPRFDTQQPTANNTTASRQEVIA